MKTTYLNISYEGSLYPVIINETEICPLCAHSLKPTLLNSHIIKDNENIPLFYASYFCAHCYDIFIAKYSNFDKQVINSKTHITFSKLEYVAPTKFKKHEFEPCINEVSPNFVNIYNQALEAEHYKLDQIAGVGYRKALEFLIKDFLVLQFPDSAEKIKKTSLGNCINNHIESPQLKIVASRASWLGNDQTHYIQDFKDKDIADLKKLITLSVHWITMIYLTNEAENFEKPN